MKCEELFRSLYGREAGGISFLPYRLCPLGAHTDHNLGKVTGFAIDRGIHIAYSPDESGAVEMTSLQFPGTVKWSVNSVPAEKSGDWADYLRGATLYLGKKYRLTAGIRGVAEGSLPVGGLSSSAAVTLTFLNALCEANEIKLTPGEMIDIAYESERKYVGVSLGKLDQSCEVLCKKNHLLFMDTLDSSYELIPEAPGMKPYEFAVFFSGLEHNLTGSKYNLRVDELKAGAYALQAFSGMDYGKFGETYARNVPQEVYYKYKDSLPLPWMLRCEHWYTEVERAEKGAEAWRRGDIEEFGRLVSESGRSSIDNWQSGSPEQIKLYEIMTQTEGVYGGRFAGAGFKGFCFAITNPGFRDEIAKKVSEAFLKEYPALEGKYGVYFCNSSDGCAWA